MRIYWWYCWLLASFFALTDAPLYAGWVAIDTGYLSSESKTVYIDPNSIRKDGNWVTISAIIDWDVMQGGRSPTRFYSTKITKQFDCAGKLVRTLAATDFYGHMGTGEVIGGGGHTSESQWVDIEPGTINQGLWEAACGKG